MNLDNLTVGEVKQLAALIGGGGAATASFQSAHLGKYVVVRTYTAGVHCGVLKRKSGQEVELTDARRIWRWFGAKTLSEVSLHGIDTKNADTNVSEPVSSIELTQAIEVLPCTDKAEASLRSATWNRK